MIAAIRQISLVFGALAAVAATWPVAAESLIRVCQPRTARGEAAGLYLDEYFPFAGGLAGVRLRLPGESLRQPIQLVLGQQYGVAIVQGVSRAGYGPIGGMWGEVVLFRTDPLQRAPMPRDPEWEPVQVLCGPFSPSGGQAMGIVERRRAVSTVIGRVRIVRLRAEPGGSVRIEAGAQWATPGTPVAAAADWPQGRLYVLSEAESHGAVQLTSIDMDKAEPRSAILAATAADTMRPQPAGLALAVGGARLCVLTSAYSQARSDGGRVSTIQWVDAASLETIGAAQEIAGSGGRRPAPLIPRGDGTVWAPTYDEATGFAYASAVAVEDDRPATRREESFRAAPGAPRLAVSPDGAGAALVGGRSLRILATDGGDAVTRTFTLPLEALAWGDSGLYVGEGPRVHSVDPQAGESVAVSGAAEGFIIDLCVLASHSERAHDDHGGDWAIPARIELDAQTPGRDTRVIPIDLARGERARLVQDARGKDWLHAKLAESEPGETRLILSLDKPSLPGGGVWSTDMEVEIEGRNAAARTVTIDVDAFSIGGSRRAIEWQTGNDSGTAYDALRRILASPPLHLSYRERRGPFSRPPRGSAAAVVRLEDVARGAITRQVLLDYVSGGGGLLVIAGHTAEPGGEGLRRWLEPLGLLIEPGEEVSGQFPVTKGTLMSLGVDQLSIAAGAYMEVTRPMDVCVQGPAPGTAVLAMTRYGYGRLAVLASDTPLGDRAMTQQPTRRFARSLFGWLAGTNTTVHDSDLDGLRDDVEDANASGTTERGETGWLRDDTDGDGIPDGAEDSNLNGLVDEGETDPRRGDTDGDGFSDGADAEPLPRSGSPVILTVQPSTAPAQGGTPLEIAGRNLPVNPQVWFGDQRAAHVVRLDSTRLIAMPPPRAYGMPDEPMPVRVAHPLGVTENTLERAFTYSDATPVRVVLESIDRVRRTYDGYRGTLSLTLDLGEVQIDYGAFYLQTAPQVMSLGATLERGAGLIAAGRDVSFRSYPPVEFLVVLGPGEPLTGRVELGTLTWHLANPSPPAAKFQWYVFSPDLRVQWGGTASVGPSEHWTDLDSAEDGPPAALGAPAPP